ncbi:hypothetical protein [Streptomyces sp. NPDC056683]|uniref:hypothetical protein n=1 Tax=Streptomyces sp. NPDC056683 TaxID=3345910 RepID=UPI0036B71EE8
MSIATTTTSVTRVLKVWSRAALHPLLVVPLALIVSIPAADAFLPPDIHLAHLLVIATAVTAMGAGPRPTALIGGLAILALIAAERSGGPWAPRVCWSNSLRSPCSPPCCSSSPTCGTGANGN